MHYENSRSFQGIFVLFIISLGGVLEYGLISPFSYFSSLKVLSYHFDVLQWWHFKLGWFSIHYFSGCFFVSHRVFATTVRVATKICVLLKGIFKCWFANRSQRSLRAGMITTFYFYCSVFANVVVERMRPIEFSNRVAVKRMPAWTFILKPPPNQLCLVWLGLFEDLANSKQVMGERWIISLAAGWAWCEFRVSWLSSDITPLFLNWPMATPLNLLVLWADLNILQGGMKV